MKGWLLFLRWLWPLLRGLKRGELDVSRRATCPACDVPLDGGPHETWCERTAGDAWSL